MDQNGAKSQEGGETGDDFFALLTPHRSLSPRGFLILMSVICVISFVGGMAFFLVGAWPVFGFFVLDALAIYYAFRLNYRSARAYERVLISGGKLTITRVSASGKAQDWTFNPYWARVELASRPGRSSQLCIGSHGRSLVLGAFLAENERQEFAAVLEKALHANRNPVAV